MNPDAPSSAPLMMRMTLPIAKPIAHEARPEYELSSVTTIVAWLTDGPLQLSAAQLSGVQTQMLDTLSANQSAITAGALTTAATIGEILTQTLLVLFTLIFFLHGGAGI